ncbi:MAG: uL22 family ribosomal protein [Nanoarchaeota archaeon]
MTQEKQIEKKQEKSKKERITDKKIKETKKEKVENKKTEKQIEKKQEKSKKEKNSEKQNMKPKKTTAIVDARNIPISNKVGKGICRFIKGKTIENAIKDLEQVILKKKVVPLRGEIPHKPGKGISSGRYPKNASREFILLLKGLKGNSMTNELEEPIIISEAMTNKAQRPFGKFGRVQRKRAHVKIIAKSKKLKENNKEKL